MSLELKKRGIYRFFALQVWLTFLLSCAAFFLSSKTSAYSVVLGGAVAIFPEWIFAQYLFKYQGARAAKKIVAQLFIGEGLKLLTTGLLFYLVFRYIALSGLFFFGAYVVVLLTFWVAPLLLKS